MPIRPPNLDDRRYADLVAEARQLIPQYCPEWTNLNDSDPGITLVQLFAWMTEMIIFRLNRVPDKTYIHFLNFIGEERKPALPAVAPATFTLKAETPSVELTPFTRVSTRQREEAPALGFLSTEKLTVHGCAIDRVVAVRGGRRPLVRELPFHHLADSPSALVFGMGRGMQVFEMDPVEFGPDSYTPHQFLYLSHDDFRLMDMDPFEEGRPVGRMGVARSSSGSDGLSVVNFFDWEYPTAEGWRPVPVDTEPDEVLGMPVQVLLTAMPGIVESDDFRLHGESLAFPETVSPQKWWIRGRLAYERWLAGRMNEDLEVFWKDDRGGAERPLNNWEVRAAGRTLLFALPDLPPIRGGWTVRFALVDRGLPAGRNGYLPAYRWSYRRGESWEPIPADQVRMGGTTVLLTGPLPDMANDGFNLRAERVETVFLRGLCPDLDVDLDWKRPVEVDMYVGDDPRRVERLLPDEAPWSPFQINAALAPTIGRKWYIGSDLFENRAQKPVLVEMEVGFDCNGEPVEEPVDDYLMQLTYRAGDNWRVVWSKDKEYASFTFATKDEEGAKKPGKRRIRFIIDPASQLKGLARHTVGERETTWLRLELVKSNLTHEDKEKNRHPVVPRIYAVRLGADKTLGDGTYDQPMPGPRSAQLDYRDQNRRLTRVVTRAARRLSEFHPFFPFMDLDQENLALYLRFDKPLPRGLRHAINFRCRGESFLPQGTRVDWEILEKRAHGKTAWGRIASSAAVDNADATSVYDFTGTGQLSFEHPDPPGVPDEGFWMRARFDFPEDVTPERFPAFPPITHVLLNTVDAVNLSTVKRERFSGYGVPNQVIRLRRKPIFVHHGDGERGVFPRPEAFPDIRVLVDLGNGRSESWRAVPEGSLLTAGKDDRVFVVDPVEGALTFGNGLRGRMLPVGTNNVIVDVYHAIPGAVGNVAAGAIRICEALADSVKVVNLLPAVGGRDAETIEEIVKRAPSLLTSRDRAVTRSDFEIIAQESSGEVARAACSGDMAPDGSVEVVILPRRRQGEEIPDPFLAVGLRDHVQDYLKRRCLINVKPRVRLATFRPIDVSLTVRLRPNANLLVVRERAIRWVKRFLDPYRGGLDRDGWPFGGTLYAQDLARLVSDIPEIRHVSEVQLYDVSDPKARRKGPGWELGQGVELLQQVKHDLFWARRIRVLGEELGA
jgi:hypothetical protein